MPQHPPPAPPPASSTSTTQKASLNHEVPLLCPSLPLSVSSRSFFKTIASEFSSITFYLMHSFLYLSPHLFPFVQCLSAAFYFSFLTSLGPFSLVLFFSLSQYVFNACQSVIHSLVLSGQFIPLNFNACICCLAALQVLIS